jgi:hypothetical protein
VISILVLDVEGKLSKHLIQIGFQFIHAAIAVKNIVTIAEKETEQLVLNVIQQVIRIMIRYIIKSRKYFWM